VRHIGVSNFDVDQLRPIGQIAPVETLQPQYSLIEHDAERQLLPFAQRQRTGVIVYSPMGSGMLSGGITPSVSSACRRMTGANTTHGSPNRSTKRALP
jgi:aryl-alcohol dehydrogenase-like predicted oxidoreductase